MVFKPVNFVAMSLHAAEVKSSAAERDAQSSQEEVRLARLDIERLLILTEALWLLLKRRHNLDDSVLTNLIEEIDMRDGQLDGRVTPKSTKECPSCKRPVGGKRGFCLFCGVPVAIEPFER